MTDELKKQIQAHRNRVKTDTLLHLNNSILLLSLAFGSASIMNIEQHPKFRSMSQIAGQTEHTDRPGLKSLFKRQRPAKVFPVLY